MMTFSSSLTGSNQKPNSNASCIVRNLTANNFSDSSFPAIETLKFGGYTAMASFLALPDEIMMNRFREYPSFFLRHAVPCRLF
ncbi:hypothetical protein HN51_013927 [Arachis hypogaea]